MSLLVKFKAWNGGKEFQDTKSKGTVANQGHVL